MPSQKRRGKHTYHREHGRSRTAVTSQNEARQGRGIMSKWAIEDRGRKSLHSLFE